MTDQSTQPILEPSLSAEPRPSLIRDVLRPPQRYYRSIYLERDFDDVAMLEDYVVTPPMAAAFTRILEGLRPDSGRRAWRITGDYGSGKSSFALMLAHVLRDPDTIPISRTWRAVDPASDESARRLLPVLITGAREGLDAAIGRGLVQAERRFKGLAQVSPVEGTSILERLNGLRRRAVAVGFSGVILILDELGKLLEYAAMHPEQEDIFVLQCLAEAAARSGHEPLVVLGLLHQGFHAYAERLPSVTRHEWDKVAGRFEEIIFDQPLEHAAALVKGALSVQLEQLPDHMVEAAQKIAAASYATGWFGSHDGHGSLLQPLELYPLHPTVLPVLVRFFARFGQHERSLFSLLLSFEPFGLQTFAERPVGQNTWYRLPDFYNYVRAVFGYRLAGMSYRSQWARVIETVDSSNGVEDIELRVLKSVALLNLLDAEDLLATDAVLTAAIQEGDEPSTVSSAVQALRRQRLLFERGVAGGYCLWPHTSIDIESALAMAARMLGEPEHVSVHLVPHLDAHSLLARRHYVETGTLRHFELRYCPVTLLHQTVERPSDADGIVVIALCDTVGDRSDAISYATGAEARARPGAIIGVSPPLIGLAAELNDVRCWQWVTDNTPELASDSYAAAEVKRQLSSARHSLAARLESILAVRDMRAGETSWFRAGQTVEMPKRGLMSILSDVCNELYPAAPVIINELLNRRSMSSAAAAARMRLIERMFSHANQESLGIDTRKAPPEKSMYLSVLAAGHVHQRISGGYALLEPPPEDDPLRLRPALSRILEMLEEANGGRVSVTRIMTVLSAPPFGIRTGVSYLLLAHFLVVHAHEVSVYEKGSFSQHFGAADFLRLTKLPTVFDLQLSRVTGVRVQILSRLSELVSMPRSPEREIELLDVVTPLCSFAAQLPEYTRLTKDLSPLASRARDALLRALEPATLVFHDLPIACGVEPDSFAGEADPFVVEQYVERLGVALAELRFALPRLLERLRAHIIAVTTQSADGRVDREDLAERAESVALTTPKPKLRAFALRLADRGLADDRWAASVGSLVISRPPHSWLPGDETRAGEELEQLGALFRRVEALVYKPGTSGRLPALRIGLTRPDGNELVEVVKLAAEDKQEIDSVVDRLAAHLPSGRAARIGAVAELLWRCLADLTEPTHDETQVPVDTEEGS